MSRSLETSARGYGTYELRFTVGTGDRVGQGSH
jgi:hypothetical protein